MKEVKKGLPVSSSVKIDQYNEVDGHNSINISHTALSMFDTMIWVKGSETKDGITDFFDNEP